SLARRSRLPHHGQRHLQRGHSGPAARVLKRDGKRVMANIDGESIPLPDVVHERFKGLAGSFNGLLEESAAYFSAHCDACLSYFLSCVDRVSGKELWKERVWASGGRWMYAGIGHHFTSLARTGDTIIVFGLGDDCAYVEGFDAKSGKNAFRFS